MIETYGNAESKRHVIIARNLSLHQYRGHRYILTLTSRGRVKTTVKTQYAATLKAARTMARTFRAP